MPADDWALAQGTVEFREEERRARNRTDQYPMSGYEFDRLPEHEPLRDEVVECPRCGGEGWYVDHADECYETGYCECSGVQRQCECVDPGAPVLGPKAGGE